MVNPNRTSAAKFAPPGPSFRRDGVVVDAPLVCQPGLTNQALINDRQDLLGQICFRASERGHGMSVRSQQLDISGNRIDRVRTIHNDQVALFGFEFHHGTSVDIFGFQRESNDPLVHFLLLAQRGHDIGGLDQPQIDRLTRLANLVWHDLLGSVIARCCGGNHAIATRELASAGRKHFLRRHNRNHLGRIRICDGDRSRHDDDIVA